jgi:hypothetical protein
MANLNGINIIKGKQGANVLLFGDGISGLIVSAVATDKLAIETPTVVYNIKDVENLGITAQYDKTNAVNCYRHLSEFYRNAGSGTELHLMLVNQTTSMPDIVEGKAKKLLAHAEGKIRQLAIAINLPTGSTVVMLDGIPDQVNKSIAKAQGLALWAYENNMPCQVFLEGYNYGGTASSTLDLRAIANTNATKVSVFIGQDYGYASGLKYGQKYADVGTLLGICSNAKVNENVGNNELYNITDATKEAWIIPGLSSHTPNIELFDDLQTLENKGYLFGVTYTGMAGVRINNDHTCTPIIVDSDHKMNEHTIAYGRVMDKAVRGLRTAYLPKVKTDWVVNAETGKMSPGVVVALEDIGDKMFADMIKREEITYGKTTIDKESDLLVEKILKISFVIVPRGSIGEIQGTINLKTTK